VKKGIGHRLMLQGGIGILHDLRPCRFEQSRKFPKVRLIHIRNGRTAKSGPTFLGRTSRQLAWHPKKTILKGAGKPGKSTKGLFKSAIVSCNKNPHNIFYAVQRWGLRGRWELSQIGDSERALQIMIYSKLSLDFLPLWNRFWEFWANNLKSRLQLNDAPVHKTHSAKVRKIITTSETPSLKRIVRCPLYFFSDIRAGA